MTKVIITPSKPVVHRKGNFYESDEEVFILAHVNSDTAFPGPHYMCLISLVSGNRHINPTSVPDVENISEKLFSEICGGGKFNLIETITVNFSK
jgi:hypothetical protein